MHRGVDISYAQTTLDYQAMAAAGIEFALIRMSQGTTIKDGQAPVHVAGCIAAGIPWGGYHFFDPATPVATQAVYFMGMLTHFPAPTLPPMLDVEWEDPLGWAHLASVSVDCLRMIETDSDFPNGLYYCNPYFAAHLPGFPFTRHVVIDLAAPTATPGTIPHLIRQLAPQPVPGCPTPVDVDLFVGSQTQWYSFIDKPQPPILEVNMQCTDPTTGGLWTLGPDGHVEASFDAPYLGGLNNHPTWHAETLGTIAGFAARKTQFSYGYDIAILLPAAKETGSWFDHYYFPRSGVLAGSRG